jgi:hypothetical protein
LSPEKPPTTKAVEVIKKLADDWDEEEEEEAEAEAVATRVKEEEQEAVPTRVNGDEAAAENGGVEVSSSNGEEEKGDRIPMVPGQEQQPDETNMKAAVVAVSIAEAVASGGDAVSSILPSSDSVGGSLAETVGSVLAPNCQLTDTEEVSSSLPAIDHGEHKAKNDDLNSILLFCA